MNAAAPVPDSAHPPHNPLFTVDPFALLSLVLAVLAFIGCLVILAVHSPDTLWIAVKQAILAVVTFGVSIAILRKSRWPSSWLKTLAVCVLVLLHVGLSMNNDVTALGLGAAWLLALSVWGTDLRRLLDSLQTRAVVLRSIQALLSTVAVIVGVLILGQLAAFLTNGPLSINTRQNGGLIDIRAVPPDTLPFSCVTLTWQFDGEKEIYLDGQGIIGVDSRKYCNTFDLTPTFRAVFRDNTSLNYTLNISSIFSEASVLDMLLLSLIPALIAAYLLIERRSDYFAISALLLLAGIPLLLTRIDPTRWSQADALFAGMLVLWLIVAALWLGRGVYMRRSRASAANSAEAHRPASRLAMFGNAVLIGGLLIVFAILFFYVPMRWHFWVGTDEITVLQGGNGQIWSSLVDGGRNRPLTPLMTSVAQALSPTSLAGFLWVTVVAWFGTGLALYAILREFFPKARGIWMAAFLLFIVNPSEPGRYIPIALNQHSSVFLFALAVWLYLHSYRRQQRLTLLLACIALGVSLLIYEAALPLALLTAVLIFFLPKRSVLSAWFIAWLGTTAIIAIRYVLFLIYVPYKYQTNIIANNASMRSTVLHNLNVQLAPLFSYFQSLSAVPAYLLYGAGGVVFTCVLLWWITRRLGPNATRTRRYIIALPIAAFGLILSVLPYLPYVPYPFTDYDSAPTYRVEFYAAPIQAMIFALVIGLIMTRLSRQLSRVWLISATSILVLLGVSSGFSLQANNGVMDRTVTLKNTVSILRQVKTLMPNPSPDSPLFFILRDDQPSPLGWNNYLINLSCFVFGVPAYQGTYSDTGLHFRTRGTTSLPDADFALGVSPTEKVYFFEVGDDGTVTRRDLPVPLAAQTTDKRKQTTLDCENITVPSGVPPIDYLAAFMETAPGK